MKEDGTVLDASALLAYLRFEPGAEVVADALGSGAVISTISLAEVFTKAVEGGRDPLSLADDMTTRGTLHSALLVEEFTYDDSIEAARFRPLTRHLGLSLADRACLALARRMEFRVLTADKAWADLDVGVEMRFIR